MIRYWSLTWEKGGYASPFSGPGARLIPHQLLSVEAMSPFQDSVQQAHARSQADSKKYSAAKFAIRLTGGDKMQVASAGCNSQHSRWTMAHVGPRHSVPRRHVNTALPGSNA